MPGRHPSGSHLGPSWNHKTIIYTTLPGIPFLQTDYNGVINWTKWSPLGIYFTNVCGICTGKCSGLWIFTYFLTSLYQICSFCVNKPTVQHDNDTTAPSDKYTYLIYYTTNKPYTCGLICQDKVGVVLFEDLGINGEVLRHTPLFKMPWQTRMRMHKTVV